MPPFGFFWGVSVRVISVVLSVLSAVLCALEARSNVTLPGYIYIQIKNKNKN